MHMEKHARIAEAYPCSNVYSNHGCIRKLKQKSHNILMIGCIFKNLLTGRILRSWTHMEKHARITEAYPCSDAYSKSWVHEKTQTKSQNILMYKTMSLQFPYYYFNRSYYSTLVDHEFEQEEFLNLSKFYWCNSK